MTYAELTTLLLGWLDDANAGYFTSTLTNQWLKNATKEVQKQLIKAGENFYRKTSSTTLVVDQADYALPSDFLKVHRLEVILSGSGTSEKRRPLKPITLNSQDFWGPASGTPEAYDIGKDRVTLFPTPDTALTLRLYYSYRVADFADTTETPDVPEEFHEYIAILAAEDGFIKDDRMPANLLRKKELYEKRLSEMAEDRRQDVPRQVIDLDEDGIGFIY